MWHSIDDLPRTRRAFESAATKKTIYFLLGMSLLSGVLALIGIVQLKANPNLWNQIPEPLVLAGAGIIGFAIFFPWFIVIYSSRHFLFTVKQLEREIERLRKHVVDRGNEIV